MASSYQFQRTSERFFGELEKALNARPNIIFWRGTGVLMRTLEDVPGCVQQAHVLLVVPPFAGLDRPSLAAHILQACAKEAGFSVTVLYANLLLASEIGEKNYEAICYAPSSGLIGERYFAATAYGLKPLGRDDCSQDAHFKRASKNVNLKISFEELQRLEAKASDWVDALTTWISQQAFSVVGCTTTFEQTSASIAILNAIKRKRPQTITIIGGANAEGEMAEGLRSIGASIDYIFAGESEYSFPWFLNQTLSATPSRLTERIIQGTACRDLNRIPTPVFDEYYIQFDAYLRESIIAQTNSFWLPFETSRGCWWGQKHHCTFCGINGQTLEFREKSPDRVVQELESLLRAHPSNKICMVDNIMPHTYFRSLLPRMEKELPGLHIFYEQKANLSLENVVSLKRAGVAVIQPGIEALSTPILKLMDKGVTARQNIALLRYARAADLSVNWNLLYAFPGDKIAHYKDTLLLLRLIQHLHPPTGLFHLSIDRFSPYFFASKSHGVTNVRPMEAYSSVLPLQADSAKIAYHFVADYESESRDDKQIIPAIFEAIQTWRKRWEDGAPPMLELSAVSDDQFLLIDTRQLPGNDEFSFISREQASLILMGTRSPHDSNFQWAIDRKLIVPLDAYYVPVVTARPEVMKEFDSVGSRLALPTADLVTITSQLA
jgi:ribosomal peptide maturation radical SAM protein 1